ncbi:hypothetical protein O3890_02800 [Veillonella nakazawae]|uniref:hypothetical protein n=1 Tax=Veillonella nakazawae TaxID=2682456 RepID=UPI00352E3F24
MNLKVILTCKLNGDYMWVNIISLLEKVFKILLSHDKLYYKVKLLVGSLIITLMLLFIYRWDLDKFSQSIEVVNFQFFILITDVILCIFILLDLLFWMGKKIKNFICSIIYLRKKKKLIADKLSNDEINFLVYNFYDFSNFEFKAMEYIELGIPLVKALYDKQVIRKYGQYTNRIGNYNYKLEDDVYDILNQALSNGDIRIDINDRDWQNVTISWFNRK